MTLRVLGFLLMVAVAICSAPPVSRAQQAAKVWRIGFLGPPLSSEWGGHLVHAFQQDLRERGGARELWRELPCSGSAVGEIRPPGALGHEPGRTAG